MIKTEYAEIRTSLEEFLPSVGKKLLKLWHDAKNDPNFVQSKDDKTIVTEGDTLSEDLIIKWINDRFPNDSVRGEERGDKSGGNRMWIIDPIDGTLNFKRYGGKFAISVGLAEKIVPRWVCYTFQKRSSP